MPLSLQHPFSQASFIKGDLEYLAQYVKKGIHTDDVLPATLAYADQLKTLAKNADHKAVFSHFLAFVFRDLTYGKENMAKLQELYSKTISDYPKNDVIGVKAYCMHKCELPIVKDFKVSEWLTLLTGFKNWLSTIDLKYEECETYLKSANEYQAKMYDQLEYARSKPEKSQSCCNFFTGTVAVSVGTAAIVLAYSRYLM
jgi:hypothetical protein